MGFWRAVAWGLAGAIAFLFWMSVCIQFYIPSEISRGDGSQPTEMAP